MKALSQILEGINNAVDQYSVCKLGDVHTQSDIARELAVNLAYLSDHKIEAHERWNLAFEKSDKKSDKKKEIDADNSVPELYKIRQIQRSAEKLLEVVRTTISANK